MEQKEKVCAALDELGIEYKMITHPPVCTIEEMDEMGIFTDGEVCKNLFLRNANGKIHYLVCCLKDKHVDLVKLRSELSCSTHLGLTQGAVSPFGVINNADHEVVVVLDRDIKNVDGFVGFHPNDNTAFVWLRHDDLIRYIKHFGNDILYVEI